MTRKIWNYIIGGLLIVGGILLIINPKESISGIIWNFGLILFIAGVLGLLISFINKSNVIFSSNYITTTILGIIIMLISNVALNIISMIIGVSLIFSSIINLSSLSKMVSNEIVKRSKTINIIKIVLGIIIIVTPISYIFTGLILGIGLIILGIYTIINYKDDNDVTYRVKVK